MLKWARVLTPQQEKRLYAVRDKSHGSSAKHERRNEPDDAAPRYGALFQFKEQGSANAGSAPKQSAKQRPKEIDGL